MIIREIIRRNPVLRYLYEKLSLIIVIKPYYLIQEFLFEEENLNLRLKLDGCTVGFLTPTEIKAISANPEVPDSEDDLLKRLTNGCQGFGIKHNGEIIAYMWCNLRECNHWSLPFLLKEDEAYLFDARTFKAYRGNNLAPYLRYQLYEHLKGIGRNKFFSISVALDTSSLNFKKKLKAKPIKLYLYVDVLQRFHWTVQLKHYSGCEKTDLS